MTNNCYETDHAKNARIITEGELWQLVETGRENFKNNGVTDGVMDFDVNEYSSHAFPNPVDQKNGSEWVLVTRYRNGKKRWTTYQY